MNILQEVMPASLEGVRPVFQIVTGVFLLVITWRLASAHVGWWMRTALAGAWLLAVGYGLIGPLFHAGVLPAFSPALPSDEVPRAMAWHIARTGTMNIGWLLFGLGLAGHAGLFRGVRGAHRPVLSSPPPSSPHPHESAH